MKNVIYRDVNMEKGIPMNEKLKQRLIRKARKIYSKIEPCGLLPSLDDCFTIVGNDLVFWFNTQDMLTHALIEENCKSEHNGIGHVTRRRV